MIAVADTGNHRIQVFHPDGTFAFKFGTRGDGDGEFESPAGVAFDDDDLILVADTGNHRVQGFSIDGEFLWKFGSHGSGPLQFDGPRDVHGDSETGRGSEIIVVDTGNDRIQFIVEPVHPGEAKFQRAIGPNATEDEPTNRPRTGDLKLDGPSSVDIGRYGGFRLAVADTGNDRVQISWSFGRYPRNFGSAGTAVGEFWSPSDVAMNWYGALAVADTGNHRVQVFGHDGTLQFENRGEGAARAEWAGGGGGGGAHVQHRRRPGRRHWPRRPGRRRRPPPVEPPRIGRHRRPVAACAHLRPTAGFNYARLLCRRMAGSAGFLALLPLAAAVVVAAAMIAPTADADAAAAHAGVGNANATAPDGLRPGHDRRGRRRQSQRQGVRLWRGACSRAGIERQLCWHRIRRRRRNVLIAGRRSRGQRRHDRRGRHGQRPRAGVSGPTAPWHTRSGRRAAAWGSSRGPRAVAFVPWGGMIAVADTGNHRVQVFHPGGVPAFVLGSEGGGVGELSSPAGVAAARDGMIAVADTGNDRVQVFYIDGTFAFGFGSHGGGDGQFDGPRSASFSRQGDRMAVADTGNGRVQVFEYARIGPGEWLAEFSHAVGSPGGGVDGGGQTKGPGSAAFGPSGRTIAVSDAGSHRIQVFRADDGRLVGKLGLPSPGAGHVAYVPLPSSVPLRLPPPDMPAPAAPAGPGGASGMPAPAAAAAAAETPSFGRQTAAYGGIAVDLSGAFAVVDSKNNRVQVFHAGGAFEFGRYGDGNGEFNDPRSAAYSPSGDRIAVADFNNHRVQVFHAANGTLDFMFGGHGVATGKFDTPTFVAYSPSGDRIAVADSGNHRVQVFHPDGTFDFELSGPGAADGKFDEPASVEYSSSGDMILVAHRGNHSIQVFRAAGGEFAGMLGSWARDDRLTNENSRFDKERQYDAPGSAAYSPSGSRESSRPTTTATASGSSAFMVRLSTGSDRKARATGSSPGPAPRPTRQGAT